MELDFGEEIRPKNIFELDFETPPVEEPPIKEPIVEEPTIEEPAVEIKKPKKLFFEEEEPQVEIPPIEEIKEEIPVEEEAIPIGVEDPTKIPRLELPEKKTLFQKMKSIFRKRDPQLTFEKERIKDLVAIDLSERFNIRPSQAKALVDEDLENTFQQTTKYDPIQHISETGAMLLAMPVQFIAGKTAGLGTIASFKMFSDLAPEKIRQKAEERERKTGEFLVQPTTELAKNVSEVLGTVFEKVLFPAHWVDKTLLKDYPNLGYVVGLMGELAILGAVPKATKASSKIIKNLFEEKTTNKKVINDSFNEMLNKTFSALESEKIQKSNPQGIKESVKEFENIIDKATKEVKENKIKEKLKDLKFEEEFPEFDFTRLPPGEINVNALGNPKIKISETLTNKLKKLEVEPESAITKYFKTPSTFFNKHKPLKPLWFKAQEIKSKVFDQKKEAGTIAKELMKDFKDKKERQKLGAFWMASSLKGGAEALAKLGIKVEAPPRKYLALKEALEPIFKDYIDKVNEIHELVGKKPVKEIWGYLPLLEKKSAIWDFRDWWKNISKSDKLKDDVSKNVVLSSPHFAHLVRGKLKPDVKLDLDPISLYLRYTNNVIPYIEYTPLNAFIKDLTTKPFTDRTTGRTFNLQYENPQVAKELISWSNALAGMPNLKLPKNLARSLQTVNKNLTAATLFGNLRTTGIQLTAILPTLAMYGVKNVSKGIGNYVAAKVFKGKDKIPVDKSIELKTRLGDVALYDSMLNVADQTTFNKILRTSREGLSYPMRFLDLVAAEITFRTVYKTLEPLVKKGKMSQKDAIRRADEIVIKTQGSGSMENLSPIQRNVMGKTITLWQTFAINHVNFVAKEILGIKNPELKPLDSFKRSMRYMASVTLINSLFEDILESPSPYPAPVKSFIRDLSEGKPISSAMLKTFTEIGELFPVASSLKYGSHPLGATAELIQVLGEIAKQSDFNKNLIERAIKGDTIAMIRLGELMGKLTGIPGTVQTAKIARKIARKE
jgi:hypothetical protein